MPRGWKSVATGALVVAPWLAASLAITFAGSAGVAADGRGERRVIAESKFPLTDAALQSEIVLLVVDFPPGAWTSLHTHGGQAINIVLEGEITLRHAGMERPHTAGQAWTDSTGQVHAAGNTGRGKARLLTNFLLPRGAPQITVVQDSPFEPTIAYEARFPVPALPADTEIVQQLAELSSGRRDELASVGFTAGIVVAGEISYTLAGQAKDYQPGESWSAPAGTLVTEENRAAGKARVFTTYLLPSRIGK
jgi:quercetin dioxygenase-like cupin family protein